MSVLLASKMFYVIITKEKHAFQMHMHQLVESDTDDDNCAGVCFCWSFRFTACEKKAFIKTSSVLFGIVTVFSILKMIRAAKGATKL